MLLANFVRVNGGEAPLQNKALLQKVLAQSRSGSEQTAYL